MSDKLYVLADSDTKPLRQCSIIRAVLKRPYMAEWAPFLLGSTWDDKARAEQEQKRLREQCQVITHLRAFTFTEERP